MKENTELRGKKERKRKGEYSAKMCPSSSSGEIKREKENTETLMILFLLMPVINSNGVSY